MDKAKAERAADALRQIRDALVAITQSQDLSLNALKSVAWLCAERADQALAELAS